MTRTQSFLMGAAGALAMVALLIGVAMAGNIFTIDQNGTVRLVVTDTGNVGIGTTGPAAKIEVQSNNLATVTDGLVLSNRAGDGVGTGVALHFAPNGAAGTLRTASIVSRQTTSGNFADLGFLTANGDVPEERLTIRSAGNVGIGTTDPKTKLQVTGLPEYADNAAAIAAGLTAGAFYRTGDILKVVH